MAKPIRLPERVAFCRTSVSMPPIETRMPSLARPWSGASVSSASFAVFMDSPESAVVYSPSGCPVMYRPVTLFS